MCGRFAQVFQIEDLEHIERIINQALGIDKELIELFATNFKPTYNASPTQYPTIISATDNHTNGMPIVTQAHFGLIPSWSKDRSRASSMINARSETIESKRSFASLFRSRRCILPVSGFFEWQRIPGEKTKQPWYIKRADSLPMMLAGIWDTWLDPEHGHSEVDSFSLITCDANDFMSDIHHRMPIILEPESISSWCDRTSEPRELADRLVSAPDGVLAAHRVSRKVNSAKNNDPSLIEPDLDTPPAGLWG
ncbi:MAG: SOS response-associated peptidase [Phycisphaerales bacterium]|nr:SOS response-associated peptidase [Phycisphaerales bacterium]